MITFVTIKQLSLKSISNINNIQQEKQQVMKPRRKGEYIYISPIRSTKRFDPPIRARRPPVWLASQCGGLGLRRGGGLSPSAQEDFQNSDSIPNINSKFTILKYVINVSSIIWQKRQFPLIEKPNLISLLLVGAYSELVSKQKVGFSVSYVSSICY